MRGGGLIAEGSYGCIFHPAIKPDGKEYKSKKMVSKLHVHDKNSKREIYIGNKIKKIKKEKCSGPESEWYSYFEWDKHFAPVIEHHNVNIKSIDNNFLKECSLLNNNDSKYILLQSNYVGPELLEYISNNMNKCTLIIQLLIDTYIYLLKSINILNINRIIHLDIKPNNILIDVEKQLPIIIDFGISYCIDDINIEDTNSLKKMFYAFGIYYVWAPEIYYINYLLHVNNNPTHKQLKKISHDFVFENKTLTTIFSTRFLNKYYKLIYQQFILYNNIPYDKRLKYLIYYWSTWDYYSLSMMYLSFLGSMHNNKFSNNTFIIEFSKLLLLNIHPNPTKRLTHTNTFKEFFKILSTSEVCDYVCFENMKEKYAKNQNYLIKEITKQTKGIIYRV